MDASGTYFEASDDESTIVDDTNPPQEEPGQEVGSGDGDKVEASDSQSVSDSEGVVYTPQPPRSLDASLTVCIYLRTLFSRDV